MPQLELDSVAINFINKLLIYEPELRLKPLEALMDPFFHEL